MRLELLLFLTLGLFYIESAAQQNTTIIDERDSKSYKVTKIGNQVWMAENLNTTQFRNGDIIFEAKTAEEWKSAGEKKEPAWCYYNNDPLLGVNFGKLYNWYAVIDKRGLSPEGWHVPSDVDWNILIDKLGGKDRAAVNLKQSHYWINGWSAQPSGHRASNTGFNSLNRYSGWWTTTKSNINRHAITRYIYFDRNDVGVGENLITDGFSVRCLKD